MICWQKMVERNCEERKLSTGFLLSNPSSEVSKCSKNEVLFKFVKLSVFARKSEVG